MNKVIINELTLEEYGEKWQKILYYWNNPWEIPKKKEKFKRKVQRIKKGDKMNAQTETFIEFLIVVCIGFDYG